MAAPDRLIVDEVEARRITDYLDVRAETQRADVAFVFGTSGMRPACRAAWLYKRDVVDHILCTGGINRATGRSEAQRYTELLHRCGVPLGRVFFEDQSTNTNENVEFGLRLLSQRLKSKAIKSIVAVVKWYHSRRALMTLKRHVPIGTRLYVSSYAPTNAYRQNWHLHMPGGQYVLNEWQIIPDYLARGWISEIMRDGDAYV